MNSTTTTAKPVLVGAGAFRFRVDERWDKFPANGPDGEAVAVACDSRDRVYVFLRGPRPVQVFEADGAPIATWGQDVFLRPHGIFIAANDTIFCTDDHHQTVRAFSLQGELRLTLGERGKASDTGVNGMDYRTIQRAGPPFNYPTNLAIAPSGDLYVSDGYGNARVHRFSPDGRLIQSWGEPGSGPGQFHVPHGIAVDSAGTVYVADRENSRIQLFSPTGSHLADWTDVARPCQLFIARDGMIYVAELGFRAGRWPGWPPVEPGAIGGRVSIFDGGGKLLARWGGGPDPCAPGDFFAPHGIWVDSQNAVYVAEVAWAGGGKTGVVPGTCHSLQKFVRC